MKVEKMAIVVTVCLISLGLLVGPAMGQAPSLDKWKPAFDPSGAKYKCVVSNVSHPVLKGVYAGFAIRDELWKRTNGQIYIDFKPFSMLGGEVEVLNQLQMGAIQGMGCSSVAATNLGPRFGLVNLPFLIDSFEKLDKFVGSGKLFDHFMMAMDHQGIIGLDITGYGNYGWATIDPVRNLDDAKKVKFRTAEAAGQPVDLSGVGIQPRRHAVAGCSHSPEAGGHHRLGPHPHRSVRLPRNSKTQNTSPTSTTPRAFSSGSSTRPGSTPCRRPAENLQGSRPRSLCQDSQGNRAAGIRSD